MPPQTWKPAAVEMLVQLGPFYRCAVWFEYPADITGLAEKFARHMDCVFPRACCARHNPSASIRENYVPCHWLLPQRLSCIS
jgi:hypothetical protein